MRVWVDRTISTAFCSSGVGGRTFSSLIPMAFRSQKFLRLWLTSWTCSVLYQRAMRDWVLHVSGYLLVRPNKTQPRGICRAIGYFELYPVTSLNTLRNTGWSLPIKTSICFRFETFSEWMEFKCGQLLFNSLHSIAGVFPVMLANTFASTGNEKFPLIHVTEHLMRFDCLIIFVPPVPDMVKPYFSSFNCNSSATLSAIYDPVEQRSSIMLNFNFLCPFSTVAGS